MHVKLAYCNSCKLVGKVSAAGSDDSILGWFFKFGSVNLEWRQVFAILKRQIHFIRI